MEQSRHLEGVLILAILVAIGGLYLWQNNQASVTVAVPAVASNPTDTPTPEWEFTVREVLAPASTSEPTTEAGAFVPPTLPPTQPDSNLVAPWSVEVTPWSTPTPFATLSRATPSGPTPIASPTVVLMVPELGYEPPPAQVPLRLHVDDHYWFQRPVDVSANSSSIFYYAFGSNGMRDDMRIHHGVDMPNDIGVPIHASYSGKVIFAGLGAEAVGNTIDIYPSYGNVVIIEHDDGFRGQKIWTLYAHMQAITVAEGQRVEAGDILGLIGGTGDVSGPHVHMEVRIGENSYWQVYNPLLWIVPQSGRGVVAGRVLTASGNLVEDALVTLSRDGRTIETTTTYLDAYADGKRTWHVQPDPAWRENFVMGDIPEGDYEISVTIGGQRYVKQISVRAGTTNFIELGEPIAATPQPVETDDTPS